jgi:Fe-S cluster assembly iron-binding protein IscA
MIPAPAESFWVRLATLIAGLLALLSGIAAAVQLHWAALICLPFGAAALYLWWHATRQVGGSMPIIRLTPNAARQLTAAIAREADPERTCFRIRLEGEMFDVGFVSGHDPRTEQVIRSQGVRIVILRSQAALLQGMEVDFREVAGLGKGFAFHRARSETANV